MADYRLYFIEKKHIVLAINLECDDDAAAMRAVEALADGRDMELWQGPRFIRSFPGRRPAS